LGSDSFATPASPIFSGPSISCCGSPVIASCSPHQPQPQPHCSVGAPAPSNHFGSICTF
jgi:hypothetical protein